MFEKTDSDAKLPSVATSGSAGHDLYAFEDATIDDLETATVRTGIKVKIPKNYVGFIRGRSGLAFNDKLWCFEGTIDSDYDGEIGVQLFNTGDFPKKVLKNQAIAQLVIVPYMVDKSLVKDVTRNGGFGSTDNKD